MTNARRIQIDMKLSGAFAESLPEEIPEIPIVIKETSGQVRVQSDLRHLTKFGTSLMVVDTQTQLKVDVYLPTGPVEKNIKFSGVNGILSLSLNAQGGEL